MDHSDSPARTIKAQGVGARVPRKEDHRHLAGKGNFVGDMRMPGLQEVAFLRSPLAHARIDGISRPDDISNRTLVRSEMDASDIVADSKLPTYQASSQPPLAHDKVRYVGEAVALAFAPTRAEAEDLTEQIDISYTELTPYPNAQKSLDATTDFLHEGWEHNRFMTLTADQHFDAQRENASVVVKRSVELSRQCMVPMEGMAVMAYWDFQSDQLVVVSATQVPHMIRSALSQFLSMREADIRVISPDVGGAFGYKCVLHPEEVCIAWLAKHHKRPFRYLEDRREHLVAGANSRQHHYDMTAYADKQGKILALDAVITIDGGAYSVWPFTVGLEPGQALGNLPGPYALPGYRCETRCVATNKPGFVPYRGVARTSVCFAMELTIDAVARAVGREAWQVRLDNLVSADQMPYTNIANKAFDSGDFPASLNRALEMIRFDEIRQRQAKGEPDGRLIGIGMATYTEQSAHGTSVFAGWGTPLIPGYDQATAKITADGGLELRVGVHSHGQGMETTFAQIAHEVLGIDIDRIKMLHGDTGQTPFSTGTYASRSLVMSGGAVATACETLVPRIKHIAAHLMQVDADSIVLANGQAHAANQAVSIEDIANAWYLTPHRLPGDVDPAGLETTMGYKPKVDTGAFSYSSQAAVVAIDTDTGDVELLDYVVVDDCGTQINPLVVEGQMIGGIAQGIGTAMYEEMPYDGNAQPLASTLADYILPGASEIPVIRMDHTETPSPHTAFGAKGMGEGGAIAPPAVIFNAVNDALARIGAAEVSMTPLTPHRLLAALNNRSTGAPTS